MDAFLSEGQLERYLELRDTKPTYLAFITTSQQHVPGKVLTHHGYLKPATADHFRWSDFYPVIRAHDSFLAKEFLEYMDSLGMAPYDLKGDEDIFSTTAIPQQFGAALKSSAGAVFSNVDGCIVSNTSSRRAVVIKAYRSNVPLIYVCAEPRSGYAPAIKGSVLSVSVYERDVSSPCALDASTIATPLGNR